MEVNNIHLDNLTLLNSSNKNMPVEELNSQHHCKENVKSDSIPSTAKCNRKDVGHFTNRNKIFVQTINPTLGRLEWEAQDEDYDYAQEVARSAYADMLHDDERNELYYAGLRDAVKILRSRGESVRVLDIGTGTGLLSMMAVRCGADQVIACEAFEPMAQCAEKILKSNNMADKVRVIHKRSTELVVGPGQDLPQRANLLVAELLDTELIGEGAIGTYAHAREFLLTPDALLVPSSAKVFAQVVSSPTLHSFSQPYSAVPPHLSHIRLPSSIASCPGSISVHDIQMSQLTSDSYGCVSSPITVFNFDWSGRTIPLTKNETSHHKFSPLPHVKQCEEVAETRRSLLSVSNDPDDTDPHEQCVDKQEIQEWIKLPDDIYKIEPTSNCHAVLMWWQITMDQAGDIKLSCAPSWQQPDGSGPNSVPWRDHWMQAVYHLPPPILPVHYTMAHSIKDGPPPPKDIAGFATSEDLVLTAARDEYSMWFDVSRAQGHTPTQPPAPHCSCGVHVVTPRTRLAQFSDPRRLSAYSTAVSNTLERHQNTAWLLLGDGFNLLILGQLASDPRASHVFIHERGQQGRRLVQEMIEANDFERRVTLLPDDLSKVPADMIKHQIGVVFSEPHFHTSMLPWHNIRANVLMCENARLLAPPPKNSIEVCSFARPSTIPKLPTSPSQSIVYDGDLLDEYLKHNEPWGVLRSLTSAVVLPARMTVYAMPVSFLNLWKIRAPCKQRCGFDLEIFDKMIDRARCKTDDYVEPQPLWEYPCYALHKPICLLTFDFTKDLLNYQVGTESAVNLDLKAISQCEAALRDPRNSRFGSRGGGGVASSAEAKHADGEGERTGEASDTVTSRQLYYNGVAVWVDWGFGDEKVTTGPVEKVVVGQQVTWDMCSQQGVHLPRKSVPLLEPERDASSDDDTPRFDPCCFFYSAHLKKGALTFSFELNNESSPVNIRKGAIWSSDDIFSKSVQN